MLMSPILLAAVLLVPASSLSAASLGSCHVKTDYTLEHYGGGYRFSHAQLAEVRIGDGHLVIDGAEVLLGQADRARLRRFQSELDDVIEAARGLAMEAAALAIDAVSEVALAFFGDDPAMLRLFEKRLAVLDAEIRNGLAKREGPLPNEAAFGRAIETAMETLAPMLAGQLAAKVVAAALSGGEEGIRHIEARARSLEREIEIKVTQHAKDIEARAEVLCSQIAVLAANLEALDYRHSDGSGLNLIRVRH